MNNFDFRKYIYNNPLLNESVNEGYQMFKGKMKRDLTLGGEMGSKFDMPKKSDMPKVTFKKGENVELEIQPNSYHIYGKDGRHGYMDKQLAPQLRFNNIDDYVIYESVNEEVKGEELAMKAKMILKNLLAAGPVELDDKKLVDIMLTMGLRTDKDFEEFIETNKGKMDEAVNEGKYRIYMNSDPDYPNEIDYLRFIGLGDKASMIEKAKELAKDGKNQYGDPIKIAVTAEDDISDVVWTNESVNEAPIKRKKGVELTYGQARANQETDKAIHNHIKKNYPDDYNPGVSRFHGGGKVGMLGKQGHGLVPSNIMKITKFAKLKNDKKLLGLVDQWIKIARDNNIIEK